jgi:hypothetical protein
MDNRGKLWSIDDDQKLMEAPRLPNAYFAQAMGRSEYAIRCRRNHLAAKMHQNDPSTPLDEYVRLMEADPAQTHALCAEWSEKRASMTQFLDANRKRKQQVLLQPPVASAPPAAESEDELITYICKRICDEGGSLASLWCTPHLLPCLVRHHQGFEAYARVCQVLVAQQ